VKPLDGPILATIARYYSEKIGLYGPTARGVDWNSDESQRVRFDQLLRLLPDAGTASLIDYGCGYGALLDHLKIANRRVSYLGFDISADMIAVARRLHAGPDTVFASDGSILQPADFAVASGIFNVKLHYIDQVWREYVMRTLYRLNELSRLGFAFNMLSTYSDTTKRRADLYYADPLEIFDFCKRRFSVKVALLHDYPLFEFTIVVRK